MCGEWEREGLVMKETDRQGEREWIFKGIERRIMMNGGGRKGGCGLVWWGRVEESIKGKER